jgi:hypothetical protein
MILFLKSSGIGGDRRHSGFNRLVIGDFLSSAPKIPHRQGWSQLEPMLMSGSRRHSVPGTNSINTMETSLLAF